jgi:hypothetical protein
MNIKLKDLLKLIETKNSWGKNELKEAVLKIIAEGDE